MPKTHLTEHHKLPNLCVWETQRATGGCAKNTKQT